ncbi:hypothetical protein FF80_00990 [Devosia sp. LC5]|uniref:hypothetical protein n=1 Tax=Devosia sp. LC5 TaxID=1502724 RepID=UPI0004E3E05F|nr:hypothetical protein [Devosia sp. LC5]KFC70208.1 hypothetical protein FF80_00990 [Devosia sp. LC5]
MGVFLSPIMTSSNFAGGALAQAVNGMAAQMAPRPPAAAWPSGPEVLVALFEFSRWPAPKAGDTSSINVDNCLSIGSDMVCLLTMNLSWVETPRKVEATFRKTLDRWSMLGLKEIKPT